MQLIFIRHGDPDYENDCLTDFGRVQAEALGRYLKNQHFDKVYSSPQGRAYQTALACFNSSEITVEPWLKEFWHEIQLLDGTRQGNWDFLPTYICNRKEFYTQDYLNTPEMASGNVADLYKEVTQSFDKMLANHGYVRNGGFYNVTRSNKDKIVLFCHFGITCVMLSHLTGIPYILLAQHFCALPTSITTVVTEERRQGVAQFRCIGLGESPHLAIEGKPQSFSARFCETFDSEERH